MNEWNDEAIILRYGVFHESDMWLKILFREHGLRTAFAFGATKSKVRFCGCLDVFNTIKCRIKSSRNGDYINLQESELLEAPRKLRSNLPTLGMGANCLRFLEAQEIDSTLAPTFFMLVENLRALLEGQTKPPVLTPQFFRLRIACEQGFTPELRSCSICGLPPLNLGTFIINEGQLYCEACAKRLTPGKYNLKLSSHTLKKLYSIQSDLPVTWSDDDLEEDQKRLAARLVDSFVEYHLGLKWDRGYFRHV